MWWILYIKIQQAKTEWQEHKTYLEYPMEKPEYIRMEKPIPPAAAAAALTDKRWEDWQILAPENASSCRNAETY